MAPPGQPIHLTDALEALCDAAHDFNGLLGTILLSVDLARDGEEPAEREEALALIEQTVRQTRELPQ